MTPCWLLFKTKFFQLFIHSSRLADADVANSDISSLFHRTNSLNIIHLREYCKRSENSSNSFIYRETRNSDFSLELISERGSWKYKITSKNRIFNSKAFRDPILSKWLWQWTQSRSWNKEPRKKKLRLPDWALLSVILTDLIFTLIRLRYVSFLRHINYVK